jgi:hypothetical protein
MKVGNRNLNEFIEAIQGKTVMTPQGPVIRRSDLRALNRDFGLEDKKERKLRTFEEARTAYKEENEEIVRLRPPAQSGTSPAAARA